MINPQAYSHKDFLQNPGKYVLFRTARIAESIPSSPELSIGQYVSIEYFTTRHNKNSKFGDVDMPIYLVSPHERKETKSDAVMLYACALEEFVL